MARIMSAHHHHLPDQLASLPPVAALGVGLVLLFFGRKLFWLFVGAVGFVVGLEAATVLFPHQPDWALIAGLILGLIGAIIAIFVQKMAIGIAGFLSGGYFLMTALRSWELQSPESSWVSFLIGGVIGALLMYVVFNWALIILSSISGAHLIIHPFALSHQVASVAFLALALFGILVQGKVLESSRRPETD
ncbi:hypothetical protein CfE428DRAFT_3727 [Chthoniobacter flavus Ellin428]|uniref:TM7S3/TM198-like domain-containing protein n=2 Tax=Chthoniobacter flavus TaxID=191863 RepID=B4D489_9BACT|nr:hypothetical protein CfE428DRAFT_3727 [Chthoniobacter flavus Ellin428]TCO89071.1 uncharacterized protein DUF4203 [Chthoniobacter flavus]